MSGKNEMADLKRGQGGSELRNEVHNIMSSEDGLKYLAACNPEARPGSFPFPKLELLDDKGRQVEAGASTVARNARKLEISKSSSSLAEDRIAALAALPEQARFGEDILAARAPEQQPQEPVHGSLLRGSTDLSFAQAEERQNQALESQLGFLADVLTATAVNSAERIDSF
ncbi:MAG: hypothetical protein K2X27_22355 [Candidatus Obscuribacterales bacterium]|nr:hypothetical protein [Candidatus Obscuribacterales bacterium]